MDLEEKRKEKDKFNKLHPSVRNMIVMASACNSDKAAIEPEETCKMFFKCETVDLADQELNFMFKSMDLYQ
eukprot:682062-Ditylum_brightwellii.AAC.1